MPKKTKQNRSFYQNRSFGLYIFTSIVSLLIITVVAIVGYIWYQYSKALSEISAVQMSQATEMVKEKVTNYLSPAPVMAKLSTQILRDGGFDRRSGHPESKSDKPSDKAVKLGPLIVDNPETEVRPDDRNDAHGQSGVLSIIDRDLLEHYGIDLIRAFPQLAMANIGDEQGNFMMPKKLPDGKIATKIIDWSVTPATVTWKKYENGDDAPPTIETTEEVKYDPRGRPWYMGAKKERGSYWTDVYIFYSDQSLGITTAYPIFDSDDRVIGVFSLDIALIEISRFLQKMTVGKTGVVYIINKKKEVIAYPDPSRIVKKKGKKLVPALIDQLGEDLAWVTASFQEHEDTFADRVEFESGGEQYLASFTNLGGEFGSKWKIGVVVPEDDFLGPLIHMRRIVVLITLAVLIFSVFIARMISSGISKPIMELTEETKKIENFEIDDDAPPVKSSIMEIQLMSNSMVSMKKGLKAFEKYVPSTLVRELIRTGEEAKLGGKKVDLSIFFSDIQGFTTISEKVPPESLMIQLFEYNNELTNIIIDEKGTIDKYIGDAIMAFWGAPIKNEKHALSACNAALACHRKLDELNRKWGNEGKELFITRFGIHSGPTIVGNMGSDERMNYSVLGDSVNLASRIEGINKTYGTRLIITQATYNEVSDHFLVRPLDLVAVKGKKQGVKIYELIGKKGEKLPREILELREMFTRGFEEAYLKQKWDDAMDIFTTIHKKFPSDGAAKLYVQRCIEFRKSPPGKGWDGIYRPKTK